MNNFKSFENAVLGPVWSYWRQHDEARLHESAQALRALDERVATHEASATLDVTVTGWLSGRDGYRLSAAVLRQMNPGYSVQVIRTVRKDVVDRRTHGLRVGYRVSAVGPENPDLFVFGVVARDGLFVHLPASNFAVAEQMKYANQDEPKVVDKNDENRPPPLGYVDSLMHSPRGVSSRPNTWLAAIVHRAPNELLELIDSVHGNFLADEAARLMVTYPVDPFWADRFAQVAYGRAAGFSSNMVPLTVDVPNPTPEPDDFALPLPELERQGKRVRFTPGNRLLPQPNQTWLRLPNAVVQDGGTVVVGDSLVSYEGSANPSLDFVAGQWDTVFGSRSHPEFALIRMRPLADETITEAVLLSGRNDANWFHWLIEYLPRLMQIDGSIGRDVPLAVSSRTPATGLAALRSVTDRPVIELDANLAHRFGVLHVIAPPVQILDTTRVAWSDGLSMNPTPLLALRRELGLSDAPVAPGRRVFLRRTSAHRGLLNEGELAKVALRHGLDVLDPGSMSWTEQVELFSSTSVLAGASGAVMADYLLMSPGSRILALTSEALDDFVLPAAIASIVEAEFSYVTGPGSVDLSDVKTRNGWIHSDFSVNAKDFEAALVDVLAADDVDQKHALRLTPAKQHP